MNPQGTTGTPPREARNKPSKSLPEVPPLSPDGEAPGDPLDPVTQACEAQARDLLVTRLHGEIGRVLITRHPRLGAVWRADVSTPTEGGAYAQRVVCIKGAFVLSPMKTTDGEASPLP